MYSLGATSRCTTWGQTPSVSPLLHEYTVLLQIGHDVLDLLYYGFHVEVA
jgi:hypothetical protein